MTYDHYVPAASIAGMIFTLVISVGIPIFLAVFIKHKLKARLSPLFIGCGVFVVCALILEQILHTVVLILTGTAITGNIFLYAAYGGLCAGLFEETGRYFAMKLFMKKSLTKENALMYGAGHGGIEAILLVGFAQISNIVMSVIINSGQLSSFLTLAADEAEQNEITNSLSQLWEVEPPLFFMSGLERIAAIALQIILSYIIFKAVKDKKPLFYCLAVGIHFLVDAAVVILSQYIPVAATEVILLAAVAVMGIFTAKSYKKETA